MLLQETVYFISADNLRQGFLDGSWTFCRPSWYIRQDVADIAESVAEKKRALAQTDPNTMTATLKVKTPLVVHQFTDEDGNLKNEIISGNTRTRSILEVLGTTNPTVSIGSGKDGQTFSITEVEDIPYQVATDVSLDDAVLEQAESNDYTRPHTPLDIALKVSQLKPELEAKYTEQGLKLRQAQKAATEHLTRLFKREPGTILQGYAVISKGTDKLIDFIRQGYLSVDTASVVITKVNDAVKAGVNLTIDGVLDILLQKSTADSKATGVDNIITRKMVLDYVKDLTSASSDDASDTSSDSSGSSNGSSSSSSGSSSTKKQVSKKDFIEKADSVFSKIYEIVDSELSTANLGEVDSLNKAMIEFIDESTNLIPVGEQTLQLFSALKQIYMTIADSQAIAESIEKSENTDYAKVLSKISKAEKPAKTLKAITTNEVDATTEEAPTDATVPTSEEIETTAGEVTADDTDLQNEAVVTVGDDTFEATLA